MKPQLLSIVVLACMLGQSERCPARQEANTNNWRELTPQEEEVIARKGTERPFSGRFEKFAQTGTYVCRRCGAALYRSDSKFDARCGWPSFDAAVPGAVKRLPDADGSRTEIECAHCNAHLGHVFTGEHFTPSDTRYCVNSISMDFVPQAEESNRFERAIFAGGCFWGVEYFLQEATGVVRATAGYIGGQKRNPTYEEVCSHKTGHAEAVEVVFDPAQTSFEKLARLFFEIHDPTQSGGQGPDIGEQYRSEIFYVNDGQKRMAEKTIGELQAKGWKIVTRLTPAATFWPAEDYHQDYYRHNGKRPYCHIPKSRFDKGP